MTSMAAGKAIASATGVRHTAEDSVEVEGSMKHQGTLEDNKADNNLQSMDQTEMACHTYSIHSQDRHKVNT